MVLKLISTIIFIVVLAFFCGFNLDNRCNIWFFWTKFENVPIFLTVLMSFAAGILITLPAVFFKRTKRLTPEQARAQADRLEQEQKRQLENQIKRHKKLEEAKAKAQTAVSKIKKQPAEEKPAKETSPEPAQNQDNKK